MDKLRIISVAQATQRGMLRNRITTLKLCENVLSNLSGGTEVKHEKIRTISAMVDFHAALIPRWQHILALF